MKHWIAAFRLKTLPLALGAIILGSALNESFRFDILIFVLAAGTAIGLQILSNLSNDYGDYVKGTDAHRTDRQLAGGTITPAAMKRAMMLFVILTLGSGIALLNEAFGSNWEHWLVFFGIGVASIAAAITYTVGKKAYGYNGLGDVFVFIFFGLVGVLGTAYLYNPSIRLAFLLPAISYGCLCMGVLNINNIRDLDKDVLTNKITLASKLGKTGAESYQIVLFTIAVLGFLFFDVFMHHWSFSVLGILILSVVHIYKLKNAASTEDYNSQLKFVSLGSLGVVLLFATRLFL